MNKLNKEYQLWIKMDYGYNLEEFDTFDELMECMGRICFTSDCLSQKRLI